MLLLSGTRRTVRFVCVGNTVKKNISLADSATFEYIRLCWVFDVGSRNLLGWIMFTSRNTSDQSSFDKDSYRQVRRHVPSERGRKMWRKFLEDKELSSNHPSHTTFTGGREQFHCFYYSASSIYLWAMVRCRQGLMPEGTTQRSNAVGAGMPQTNPMQGPPAENPPDQSSNPTQRKPPRYVQ